MIIVFVMAKPISFMSPSDSAQVGFREFHSYFMPQIRFESEEIQFFYVHSSSSHF